MYKEDDTFVNFVAKLSVAAKIQDIKLESGEKERSCIRYTKVSFSGEIKLIHLALIHRVNDI